MGSVGVADNAPWDPLSLCQAGAAAGTELPRGCAQGGMLGWWVITVLLVK